MLANRLEGRERVFLDSNILIYFLQEEATYLPILLPFFIKVSKGGLLAMTSFITLTELMVKPIKQGRPDIAKKYRDALLDLQGLRLFPLNRPSAERAAEIRATENFKLPDAIQLATAMVHGAQAFVTNDTELKRFRSLEVLVLQECLRG